MVDQVAPSFYLPTETSKTIRKNYLYQLFEILENSQRSAEIKQTPNQEKKPIFKTIGNCCSIFTHPCPTSSPLQSWSGSNLVLSPSYAPEGAEQTFLQITV